MQKKFITNLLILLCLNLLIKPFWILVIEPHVQNSVGNGSYGEYFAIANFSFLLNILLDFGITNFNNKNIAHLAIVCDAFQVCGLPAGGEREEKKEVDHQII